MKYKNKKDNYLKKNPSLPFVEIYGDSLPSKGLLYSLENENWSIKYRPFTVGEVKKISQSNLSDKDKFIATLEGIDCNFDQRLLTLADVMYISLLRRISSFGDNGFIISTKCHACSERARKTVKETKLEYRDIKAPSLPLKFKLDDGTLLEFFPMTIGRYFDALDQNHTHNDLRLLSYCCSNMEPKEVFDYFNGKEIEQDLLDSLKKIDDYLDHGMLPIEVECQNEECKAITKVVPAGGQALLLPFRGDKSDSKHSISFG